MNYIINLNLVKAKLREQGRSQIWLAKKLGINKNTMVSIFKKGYCSTKQLEKITYLLDCDILDFITDKWKTPLSKFR